VIELWAVEAFCLTPVTVCLFFVASVVYVGDATPKGKKYHVKFITLIGIFYLPDTSHMPSRELIPAM
jgi:hypothetical protein